MCSQIIAKEVNLRVSSCSKGCIVVFCIISQWKRYSCGRLSNAPFKLIMISF